MVDTMSPAMPFVSEGSYTPHATITLSQTSWMTPEPSSPGSYYCIKEEFGDGDDSRKPTKKRKSWGQELPTPKTNLPPRKRAKTEDEKEQRRIERVLRNRQAAQSSRERKRQEVEKLEGEKMSIEQQNESLKERLMAAEHEKFLLNQTVAKMRAQLDAVRRGTASPHELSPPPESDLPNYNPRIKEESFDPYPCDLPTPQASFGAPSTSFSSPSSVPYSISSTPTTISLSLDALTAPPDMTQHPAVMLCDLQCQSAGICRASTQPTTRRPLAIPSSSEIQIYLTLTLAIYSQLIQPLMMIFNSLKTGSELHPSTMSNPMALPLMRWLISTPINLLPPPIRKTTAPIIKKSPNTLATSTPTTLPSQTPILRLRLLRRLLLSSPSLARPLRAATGRALRPKTGSMTSGDRSLDRKVRRLARLNDVARPRGSVRSRSRGSGNQGRRNCISMRFSKDTKR